MSSIVLITQDNFLHNGIKQFLPIRHLQDVIYTHQCSTECIVLIDSRVSLSYLENVYSWLSAVFDKTKALVLQMEDETCQVSPVLRRNNEVNMKFSFERVASDIVEELRHFSSDKWQRQIYVEIDERERALIQGLLSGKTVDDIADILRCSQKQVYKLRDKMCQRLNAKHFYTVCLYVFRHDLLNRHYILPTTWLSG